MSQKKKDYTRPSYNKQPFVDEETKEEDINKEETPLVEEEVKEDVKEEEVKEDVKIEEVKEDVKIEEPIAAVAPVAVPTVVKKGSPTQDKIVKEKSRVRKYLE